MPFCYSILFITVYVCVCVRAFILVHFIAAQSICATSFSKKLNLQPINNVS